MTAMNHVERFRAVTRFQPVDRLPRWEWAMWWLSWFPRTLMGFEKLMYAYSDQPESLHEINRDLLDFNLRLLDQVFRVCVPTFTTIAEDMF